MKCCICEKELKWDGDADYDDLGIEGNGIITMLSCDNEECDVECVKIYQNHDKNRQ